MLPDRLNVQAPEPVEPFDAPARRLLRWGYGLLAVLVVGVGGWSAVTNIAGAVVAPGVIVVENRPRDIQHLDGGIIAEILVREGDIVEAGEVLVRLDPTQVDANIQILRTREAELEALIARLEAERDGQETITYPETVLQARSPEVERAVNGQDRLFAARTLAAEGQVAQLRERENQLEQQIRGLRGRMEASMNQVRLVRDELQGLRTLLARGYVARTRVLQLEREESRLQGEISNSRAEIARLRNAIGETRLQILQIEKERQSEILTQLREAQTTLAEVKEQLGTSVAQGERISVRAPLAGRVLATEANTIGEVVAPGGLLMQVVPLNENLVIETQVDPADIDQVYPGQPARVRLSAFNQRRTPELWGEVMATAPDRLVDEVTGMPYFLVRVNIADGELERLPPSLEMRPGMPAEAYMQTESRSVLSYVVKPAQDAMSRAWREE